MKYIVLVLMLGLSSCCKCNEPKVSQTTFIFKQKVKVTEGFYKGLTGSVVAEGTGYSDCYRTYEIDLEDDRYGRVPGSQMICNSRLEALP